MSLPVNCFVAEISQKKKNVPCKCFVYAPWLLFWSLWMGRTPEACFVVVALLRLLGRRKALAVMPLDDGCLRDPKLRTPAIKAAQTRPSGRLSSRSKAERGQILRCALGTAGDNVSGKENFSQEAVRANAKLACLASPQDDSGLAITMNST